MFSHRGEEDEEDPTNLCLSGETPTAPFARAVRNALLAFHFGIRFSNVNFWIFIL